MMRMQHVKAAVILALGFGAVLGINVVYQANLPGTHAPGVAQEAAALALPPAGQLPLGAAEEQEGNAAPLFSTGTGVPAGGTGALPPGFEEEVLPLGNTEGKGAAPGVQAAGIGEVREVRVAAQGQVIGVITQGGGGAVQVFEEYRTLLEARGWKSVESGQPFAGSFVKGQGRYCWLLLSCSDMADSVSTVCWIR